MKTVIASFILMTMSVIAGAQDTSQPEQKSDATPAAKIIAELHGKFGAVKNSPFSADEENESVQTLADGNRIIRKSTGKVFRNSEGRVRRELKGSQGGMFGNTFMFGDGISIANPSLGQKYFLDDAMRTATIVALDGRAVTINGGQVDSEHHKKILEQLKEAEKKMKEAGKSGQQTAESVIIEKKDGIMTTRPMTEEERAKFHEKLTSKAGITGQVAQTLGSHGGLTFSGAASKYETKTEDLGIRDFDGIQATGTRRTTTIPAGAIGNERPIEIVYERWYSKDLQMVVYSKNVDPRFGEQTYRLTNINRTEPDPSLFTVPQGYKTITSNGGNVDNVSPLVYRVVTSKSETDKVKAKPDQQ